MKQYIFCFFAILFSHITLAQVENIPLLTVYGEGTVKVIPDQAIISLEVNKEVYNTPNASSPSLEIFKDEDTRIRLFDFDDNNIVEGIIQPNDNAYKKEVFITVNDLSKLDRYLLELHKKGFRNINFIDYRIRDLNKFQKKALKKALDNATQKARVLHQPIGSIHTIEEIEQQAYNWYNPQLKNIVLKDGFDINNINPGYLTIISKIKVAYDLKK